ncbi:MAG: adenylate/guanylate cyclase domain-containing protein [Rhodobacteraceae bacterium]|nr:adenylate/guanylate cyclase domain-containing protein [Paracoccaceae bacterium]
MRIVSSQTLREELDPNSIQANVRVQEMIVFLIVAGILAVKGWRSNQLLIRQANIAAERANLSRYFPSSLVDVLASTDHDIGAVRSQDVAVLFTDIVGFTQYAEQHSPKEVMDLLRGYHAFVERAIFQNEGTLDKYLGDGVMATFGTPETKPEDASNALRAALQLVDETKTFNEDRKTAGLSSIEVSIGVHYGPVILGDIGPSRRLEFAVVGDTVNVASRLEASTRELGCQCVVSGNLIRQAQLSKSAEPTRMLEFTARDPIQLRGRKTPIDIWTA